MAKHEELSLETWWLSEDKIYRLTSVALNLSHQKPENGSVKAVLFLENSMLSDGSKWFKFRNSKDGIYKIDYDFLINNNLISGDVLSSSIHLFANNKGLLRQQSKNDAKRVPLSLWLYMYMYAKKCVHMYICQCKYLLYL